MEERRNEALRFSLFDPSGNITALVESPVAQEEQSAAAARIMARFPRVEQVGFVRLPAAPDAPVRLRMAGGEFCGNASMSAAALFLLRRAVPCGAKETVELQVSGVSRAVEVRLRRETEESFLAAVRMPNALSVAEVEFCFGAMRGKLPVVRMEGIAHAVVTEDSAFFRLLYSVEGAAEAARSFCVSLGAEAFGLMFLEKAAPRPRLTPLVFVPGSGTLCWERSCASGSAAVAAALAERAGAPVSVELDEPGGVLSAESGGLRGETWLSGRTRLTGEKSV